MLRLLDVGNGFVHWADDHGGPLAMQRLAHAAFDAGGAFAAGDVTRILGVSVLDAARTARIDAQCRECFGVGVEWQRARAAGWGVTCGYADPARFGADRWAALVGARGLLPGPLLVIDAGTALTADALDAQGRHRGGWIVPGLALMRRSLATGAEGLRAMAAETYTDAAPAFAVSTAEAIAQGTRAALAGCVREAVAVCGCAGLGEVPIVLTGGDAVRLAAWLERPFHHEPALVLEGLRRMAHASP